jgi:thiamine-phosphate pyrophosphorylase
MVATRREPCQLVLAVEAADGAAERLAAALAAGRIASVIIEPMPGRDLDAGGAGPLVEMAQRAGAAALMAGNATLARTLRADGVHLAVSEQPSEAWQTARAIVGGRAIVGADAGRSRDDAMMLGELGADYVAFGIPAQIKERETAARRQLDLIGWWAEIFEPPCVATDVDGPEAAAELAAAGADFVVLRLRAGVAVGEAVTSVRAWAEAIASPGSDATGS